MKKLYLLIPLALTSIFCSIGNPPPSEEASGINNATPTDIAARAETATAPGLPSATPAASAGSAVPSLVWMSPEHLDVLPDDKVLTVRDSQGAFEPVPVDIAVFWDYTALTGRMLYASKSNITNRGTRPDELAVSDLWVYDYHTGGTEMWLPNDVVDAKWSPVVDAKTSSQYLAAVLYRSTLVLVTGPNETTVLSEDASPDFSWSPDGRYIAYGKDDATYILAIDGSGTKKLPKTPEPFSGAGWTGDHPIWAPDQQAVIYANAPLEVAALDGSRVFTPKTAQGESPVSDRAGNILWSAEKHILAFDTDNGYVTGVWIYELSPDMATILSSYFYESMQSQPIVAWWVPGESILLRSGEIWSISEKAVIDSVH